MFWVVLGAFNRGPRGVYKSLTSRESQKNFELLSGVSCDFDGVSEGPRGVERGLEGFKDFRVSQRSFRMF